MARHPLFDSDSGWVTSRLPAPFANLNPRIYDQAAFSSYHNASRDYTTLHGYITKAIIEYFKGVNSEIGLVSIGNGTYATEWQKADGTTILFQLPQNGACRGAIKEVSGRYQALPTIGGNQDTFDTTSILLTAVMRVCDENSDLKDLLQTAKEHYETTGEYIQNTFYMFSDAVYYAIVTDAVRVNMPGGNITMLSEQTVRMGATNGTVICGQPNELVLARTGAEAKTMAFADAKKKFSAWSDTMSWTAEEENMIPSFPDDYPVPPEAVKIASRYVETHNDKRPMVNFMWRGSTSYGKSTGVELMAAMLRMPLLRVTCHSTMETQDFLSNIVPVSQMETFTGELPTFDEIACDPETAYMKLTGKQDENATPDICLEAYAKAVLSKANNGNAQLFKQVESNFVKALSRGYIVEIQEISRIKDSGVLVGLNEYDRPGAVIPLVDGNHVRRHKNAMVVYTDNVGYSSCRAIDPSVLRRMALIIDSYELPREDALARVIYNTGFEDKELLDNMYDVWAKTNEFCVDRDYTEGTVSVTELEMWAQSVKADNYSSVYQNCIDCVVSKATSVVSEQKEIISSVLAVYLNAE